MTKEQILEKLEALEQERLDIIAEQISINNDMNYVVSDSSRAAECMHQIERRKGVVNERMKLWEQEMREVEEATDALEEAA